MLKGRHTGSYLHVQIIMIRDDLIRVILEPTFIVLRNFISFGAITGLPIKKNLALSLLHFFALCYSKPLFEFKLIFSHRMKIFAVTLEVLKQAGFLVTTTDNIS